MISWTVVSLIALRFKAFTTLSSSQMVRGAIGSRRLNHVAHQAAATHIPVFTEENTNC
jgi:hypothetical protein